ncbi:hypothetical protein EVAR_11973_1 [Eumeta japonica]|uniref:Uncharacterized protein n=1 Tax=Eumeta variegata TaxID=151549 RepID=A0A4C1U5W6_EUMVA|nr:hypothetical protein EVAR_11973_1 [Eumeta japonica]
MSLIYTSTSHYDLGVLAGVSLSIIDDRSLSASQVPDAFHRRNKKCRVSFGAHHVAAPAPEARRNEGANEITSRMRELTRGLPTSRILLLCSINLFTVKHPIKTNYVHRLPERSMLLIHTCRPQPSLPEHP